MLKLVVGLRLTAALGVVLSMVAAGWWHRSPWIVVLVTPAFTMLYALGKWNAWKAAWRLGGGRRILLATLTTLPIQAILASVLYLLGLGLGRLITGYSPIATLSVADVLGAGTLFVLGLAVGAAIIRLDADAAADPTASPVAVHDAAPITSIEDLELDVDPTPLTVATFFTSPEHWRCNAAREAVEKRGPSVRKPPLAADEEMIVAAEARLGVRLPETLRNLYRVMNGGYVDWLFVPLKADPGPVFEDWRGAFSIDYSSLVSLESLRTVAEHYADFTDDPEDVPADADRLIILQARYGDMTLLDYSRGGPPRVLIVDYDKTGHDTTGADPIDVAFDDFDAFFAALRRERARAQPQPLRQRNLGEPMGDASEGNWARRLWGDAAPHPFHANAMNRADSAAPKLAADEDLVAETHDRLGLRLPPGLISMWRQKNGGGVASRFVDTSAGGDVEVMRFPVPLEYVVTLDELSDRIEFPPGETPWKHVHLGSQRLVVLEADHDRAVLLDYRNRSDDDPAMLVVDDLGRPLTEATRFERWDDLFARLRFQRSGWDDVARPHAEDLSDAQS